MFPEPPTISDPSDYEYRLDRDATRTIKVVGPLPYVLKKLTVGDSEKQLLTTLSSEAYRALYPSELDAIARRCGSLLSLEALPEAFIPEGEQRNASTFGVGDRGVVVLTSNLARVLTKHELMAVLRHDLTHAKSRHMLYHTLGARSGGHGFSASLPGLGILSIPIRLTLLSWHREAEVTADRASLLMVDDVGVIESVMVKLIASNGHASASTRLIRNHEASTFESLSELFRTNPLHTNRSSLIKQFAVSPEFLRARVKIGQRKG